MSEHILDRSGSALSARPEQPVVGEELPHESADLHVTGLALYTDDLVSRYPGALHAYPVQAPHAHAHIRAMDTSPALDVPGVVYVLTANDVPGVNDAGVKHDEPLFPSEVMYYGHPVCWVLGETLEAARIGATKVAVEYDPLPSLVTVKEAIAAESFQGARPRLHRGDPEAAWAGCAHVFEGEFEFAGQEHFYLETNAALASIDENGQIFVQSSTQHPTETQDIVAHVLGKPYHEVTVQCLRMGGAFGGKEMQPHGYAALAALGTVVTGRPVRLRFNRTQDITISGKRHGFHAEWKAGFDADGRIQVLTATLTADGGWSLDLSEPVQARALCHIDNAYWIPNIEVHGRISKTNKTSQTAFRGFGGPQGMIVIEDILGRCAPALGISARELRRRNFYQAGQSTPYGQPVRHPERITRAWDQVLETAEVDRRLVDIEAFNATHEHTKRALAITPVKFGISFNLTAFNQAGALVHVYKDGSVLINHGGTEMGQGLHTKMLQVAATALGVPLSIVRLAPTRTDKVPNTSATAASSGADLNGGAVKDACEQIRTRLAEVAAGEIGVHPADVRFVDGVVTGLAATDRTLTFAELVHKAYYRRVQLWAAGFYRTAGLHWDAKNMQGSPFKYFAYGVAASEVEVDGFTGAYRLRRVDIVHDVGDSLSPLIDIGQVEGGFVQGAGWLTLEDLRWDTGDGPHRGRLATQAASTYKLPSFSEMPEVFNVALLEKAHEDGAVYGSKAVGEPPLMLAFSVREALREAAGAFGPAGHSVDLGCPSTPEQVFWAIQAARAALPARSPPSPSPAAPDSRGANGTLARTWRARVPFAPPEIRVCVEFEMHWMSAVSRLRRDRVPGVLVTVLTVRGHAPREAGAKMVVSARDCFGSIGGGNLEQSALVKARELVAAGTREPETQAWGLTERAPARHGVQCCGGEVTVLFEPLLPVPAVAIFGLGHVGSELARILARHDIELHLVDSRSRHVEPERLAALTADALARVHTHHAVVPELVLGELPAGCHILLMTHDHAEDAALCDAALRCGHLGSIGLIGSSVKWRRFAKRLAEEGHDAAALARITTPIGMPEITGKEPATIAVSVAADLLLRFERDRPLAAPAGSDQDIEAANESAEATR